MKVVSVGVVVVAQQDVAYCRTFIVPGGPYSAGSCSSANGYGYDCSLLPLVTILCSFLLLLRKSVVLIWECGGVYVGTSGARWKSASRRKPENTQQGEAHKPGMFAATCCCCLFLVLFLLVKVKKEGGSNRAKSKVKVSVEEEESSPLCSRGPRRAPQTRSGRLPATCAW